MLRKLLCLFNYHKPMKWIWNDYSKVEHIDYRCEYCEKLLSVER